ncbi:alpha-(1,3)-fucosyltransferase C-like [Anticarsia gemmatalis]|uniref:alpha-(1,3)-fucosyltransferase C-like n=1 Tax=Anticarsia gemmatalis TaxID=129554 RepID=UPI003F7635AB
MKEQVKTKAVLNMYTYHVKEMFFVSTCKKVFLKIAIYVSFVVFGIVLMIIPHLIAMNQHVLHRPARYTSDLKYILFWSQPKRPHRGHFFTNRTPEFPSGQKAFIDQNCPNINCYITYDRHFMKYDESFDAIVFEIDEVKRMNIDSLNLTRSPDQIYIFRSSESPEKYPICEHGFDRFFNWTWTYKLNSDIPHPFFNIYGDKKTVVGPRNGMKWIEKMNRAGHNTKTKHKNKAVAWVLTKCKLKTKHQDFITELRNELKGYNYTLDIFGPCGQLKCPDNNVAKCHKKVEKNYFFQLILEEFMSDDYVTDNIVTAMSHFTIPIVLGAGDYRNFLPPGSYLNAQAFDMKKLGALIDYLIKNVDMYEYFFDWRNHYYFKTNPRSLVCDLCKKLNGHNKTVKTYKHFRYWWEPDYKDVCQRIRLYKMFNNEKK